MWFEEVARRAREHGDAVAVADERRSLTYRELRERGLRLAGGLSERGVRPGDRVAILSRNCVEVIETYMALSLLGAATVPLNHRLTAHELTGIAEAIDVRAALGERSLLEPLLPILAGERAWALGEDDYETMVACAPALEGSLPDPDQIEFVLLTSGTTSRPRCAALTRRAVRASALSWLASVRPARGTVYFSCTPLFHSTVTIAMAYLGIGAQVLVARDFSPQRAVEMIERHGVTHMYMVPSMLALTLRSRGLRSRELASLVEIFHGGAPMAAPMRRAAAEAFGAHLRDCYGQAQAGGPITVGAPVARAAAAAEQGERGAAGPPLLGMELLIVDERGQSVPVGETGEVWVRSDALMSGYLDDAHATAQALSGGWLKTGDVGVIDERGELRIVDRLADILIRGGQNVYPAEVEQALESHPAVAEAAVVGVPHDDWGEVPVAFVVAEGAFSDTDGLAAHCRERLAPYKRAVTIELLDALPRNAAGKVLKSRLRERHAAGELAGAT